MQTTVERCHFVKGTEKWSTTLANIAQASQRRIEGNHQECAKARNRVEDELKIPETEKLKSNNVDGRSNE